MKKSQEELKVLMVIPSFFPTVGGAERQLMGLASNLCKKGIKVDVVTRKVQFHKYKEKIDKYNKDVI